MSAPTLPTRTAEFEARIAKRYAAERRFKLAGLGAVLFSVFVLAFLLVTMTMNGFDGFRRAELAVNVDFTQAGLSGDPGVLAQVAQEDGDRSVLQGMVAPDGIDQSL